MKTDCECINWAMEALWDTNEHHPICPKYSARNERYFIITLLRDLVSGIERWGSECDGVPEECWDAYIRAKKVLLMDIKDD